MFEPISPQNSKIYNKVLLVIILFLLPFSLVNLNTKVVAQGEENLEGIQVRVYSGGIDPKNILYSVYQVCDQIWELNLLHFNYLMKKKEF